MRKIRLFANISLDGVIQAPGGKNDGGYFEHGGWAMPFFDSAMADALAAVQGKRFDLLFGRRTYDVFSSHWPKVESDPIADGLNAAKKYVATHRPESLAWGPAESLGTDVLKGVRHVKSRDGPDLIVWGSTTLTTALFEESLVDEVVLLVYPILLGSGGRIFSGGTDPRELVLISSRALSSGVQINTYRHVGSLHNRVAN